MVEFKTELPNLEKTIGNVVSIPVGWWVTKEEREYIFGLYKKMEIKKIFNLWFLTHLTKVTCDLLENHYELVGHIPSKNKSLVLK